MKDLTIALCTMFAVLAAPILGMAVSIIAIMFGIGGEWANDTFMWCGTLVE